MKKFLSLLIFMLPSMALAETTAGSSRQISSNFHIGLNLGVGSASYNVKGTNALGTVPVYLVDWVTNYSGQANWYNFNSLQSGRGNVGFAGSITLGYDCKMRNSPVLWGVFGTFGYAGSSYDAPYDVTQSGVLYVGPGVFATPMTTGKASVNVRSKGFFNFGMRFGFVMGSNKDMMFTTKLGFALSRYDIRVRDLNNAPTWAENNNVGGNNTQWSTASYKKGKYHPGIVLGIGFSKNMTSNLSVGVEADVTFSKEKKYYFLAQTAPISQTLIDPTPARGAGANNLVTNSGTEQVTIKLRPTAWKMMVNTQWNFPVCRPVQ